MPLFKTISIPAGRIGIWKLTETSADLIPLFSAEELADPAYRQYTHEKRKVEWLVTRFLLKQLIGPDFLISYSETGKPILNHLVYKHLSISHSRDFAAVLIHEHLDVGLDIESMNRNYHPIEKRYLSETELTAVNKNTQLHCLYWCAKEAIFKLVPENGIEFRDQIHILPFNPQQEKEFTACYTSGSKQRHYRLHFQIFDDHGLVWVANEPEIQSESNQPT